MSFRQCSKWPASLAQLISRRALLLCVLISIVSPDTLGMSGAFEAWEPDASVDIGSSRDARRIISSRWPLREDSDPVSNFVRNIGGRLVRNAVPQQGQEWSVLVIRDLAIRAFSVKGRAIYVSDGAVAAVESESELAAILAHEIGHEQAGHFRSTWSSRDFFALSALFKPFFVQQGKTSRMTQWCSLTQVLSPQKEWEADEYALGILRRSDYDPKGLLDLAQRLAHQFPSEFASWRILRIKQWLQQHPPKGAHNSPDFIEIQKVVRKEFSSLEQYRGAQKIEGPDLSPPHDCF